MLKYFSSVNDYENWKQVTINVIIIRNYTFIITGMDGIYE